MVKLGFVAAMVLSLGVVACASDEADGTEKNGGSSPSKGGDGTNVVIGPDGVPVGPDGKPLEPKLEGKYELSTTVDLTTAGLMPDALNETLRALSSFKEHPSQTIVDLAGAANVPVVPNVINAIPSPIRGFVLGYIDDHIFKALYETVPVTQKVTGLLDDLASIITRFEVISTLNLPPGNAMGDSKATHTVSGIGFQFRDQHVVVSAPNLLQKLVEQDVKANAVGLEKLSPELESGRLRLGAHVFSVPIGSFAVMAADDLAKRTFDAADLRQALGKIIDCGKLASDVAHRCIDPIGPGKICVDHEKEVSQLCSIGLDLVVGTVKAQITKLDIPVLKLDEGLAQMWDAPTKDGPLDATIDRIDHGFWTAKIRDTSIVPTFEGKRVGDAEITFGPK